MISSKENAGPKGPAFSLQFALFCCILANGGVFDGTFFDEEDGELLERCRIEL